MGTQFPAGQRPRGTRNVSLRDFHPAPFPSPNPQYRQRISRAPDHADFLDHSRPASRVKNESLPGATPFGRSAPRPSYVHPENVPYPVWTIEGGVLADPPLGFQWMLPGDVQGNELGIALMHNPRSKFYDPTLMIPWIEVPDHFKNTDKHPFTPDRIYLSNDLSEHLRATASPDLVQYYLTPLGPSSPSRGIAFGRSASAPQGMPGALPEDQMDVRASSHRDVRFSQVLRDHEANARAEFQRILDEQRAQQQARVQRYEDEKRQYDHYLAQVRAQTAAHQQEQAGALRQAQQQAQVAAEAQARAEQQAREAELARIQIEERARQQQQWFEHQQAHAGAQQRYTTPAHPQPAPQGFTAAPTHQETPLQGFREAIAQAVTAGVLAGMQAKGDSPKEPREPKNYYTKPEPFSGRRRDHQGWRHRLIQYVIGIPKDQGKILAALSLMADGKANNWALAWSKPRQTQLVMGTVTFAQFLNDFDEYFTDPLIEFNAREALKAARIGQTEDAATFFTRYNDLRTQADMMHEEHEKGLIQELEHHMPKDLVTQVRSSIAQEKQTAIISARQMLELKRVTQEEHDYLVDMANSTQTSMKSWQQYAIAHDLTIRPQAYNATRAVGFQTPERRTFTPRPPAQVPRPPTPPLRSAPLTTPPAPARSANEKPMDVDIARAQARQAARKAGLCFKCGKPGHIASAHNEEFRGQIRELVTTGQMEEEEATELIGEDEDFVEEKGDAEDFPRA